MARKASGKEFIEHKADILENIGKHFNNPDVSDVTLKVGNQEFAAHRFLLSTQSKVFMTMLMGENWKESEEKVITLQESPDTKAVFSDFLQFFYTGKLTLTIDNVCGIHTLADKYDVDVLKDDSVSFMKDVLTGIHGDALLAGLKWLQYAESVLQDIVALCYSAIRSNFVQFTTASKENMHRSLFDELSYKQLEVVLTIPEIGEELVCLGEHSVCSYFMKRGYSGLYPYMRFYNIDDLQSFEDDKTKKYIGEAYKIQAEMSNYAKQAAKKRRLSHGPAKISCSCNNSSTSQPHVCPHINPRLYLTVPFGINKPKVNPVDLSNLERFAKRVHFIDDDTDTCEWKIKVSREYSGDPIFETYKVIPDSSHMGREFTIAICCVLFGDTHSKNFKKSEYVIRHTGKVQNPSHVTGAFTLTSPFRFKGSWELSQHHHVITTILLHK